MWLDCDPGHDDALAIILALHHPRLRLLGVSTVAGNQTLAHTTDNALRVLHAAGGAHIPVHAGAARPLLRPAPLLCPQIHGDSGLDCAAGGPVLPPAPGGRAAPEPAVFAMHAALSAAAARGARPALVATGALTNIALLFAVFPALVADVDVVLMGGAMAGGNTHPVAEFNLQVDPEAGRLLFELPGVSLTMIPLDVTHSVLATARVMAALGAGGPRASPFLRAVGELLDYFATTYHKVFGFADGPPLHDPVAVAFVAAPELFRTARMRVDVSCDALTAGQTVCDARGQTGRSPPNADVALGVDAAGFWRLMLDAVRAADAASPLNGGGGTPQL